MWCQHGEFREHSIFLRRSNVGFGTHEVRHGWTLILISAFCSFPRPWQRAHCDPSTVIGFMNATTLVETKLPSPVMKNQVTMRTEQFQIHIVKRSLPRPQARINNSKLVPGQFTIVHRRMCHLCNWRYCHAALQVDTEHAIHTDTESKHTLRMTVQHYRKHACHQ